MIEWTPAALAPSATLRDAIAKLNERGGQLVLVVRDRALLGTVTDGDVRRAILAGTSLESSVSLAMNRAPRTIGPGRSRGEIRAALKRHSVTQLPVVDGRGELVGIEVDVELEPSETLASDRPNWVLIMAGGRGTRLGALTDSTPKPLLEVGNRPLLETIIRTLRRHGFKRVMLAVHYLAEMVEAHFGDGSRHGLEIRYLREPEPRGTAGALAMIRERIEAPVIVMNGDLLTNLNFERLLEYHTEKGAAVTMAVRDYSSQVPFGVVRLDEDRVTALEEKPLQRFIVNAGVYVVEPRVIPRAADGYLDMPTFISSLLAYDERVVAFPIHEYWRDIGRVEDLRLASSEYPEIFE